MENVIHIGEVHFCSWNTAKKANEIYSKYKIIDASKECVTRTGNPDNCVKLYSAKSPKNTWKRWLPRWIWEGRVSSTGFHAFSSDSNISAPAILSLKRPKNRIKSASEIVQGRRTNGRLNTTSKRTLALICPLTCSKISIKSRHPHFPRKSRAIIARDSSFDIRRRVIVLFQSPAASVEEILWEWIFALV